MYDLTLFSVRMCYSKYTEYEVHCTYSYVRDEIKYMQCEENFGWTLIFRLFVSVGARSLVRSLCILSFSRKIYETPNYFSTKLVPFIGISMLSILTNFHCSLCSSHSLGAFFCLIFSVTTKVFCNTLVSWNDQTISSFFFLLLLLSLSSWNKTDEMSFVLELLYWNMVRCSLLRHTIWTQNPNTSAFHKYRILYLGLV